MLRSIFRTMQNNPTSTLTMTSAGMASLLAISSSIYSSITSQDNIQNMLHENAEFADGMVKELISVLNRPPKFLYESERIRVESKDWQEDKEKQTKFDDDTRKLITTFRNQFVGDFNKFALTLTRTEKKHVESIEDFLNNFTYWINTVASAVNGLAQGKGTCANMAALNALLNRCLSPLARVEIIEVSHSKNNLEHIFVVIDREAHSQLQNPKTWGKNCIIVDSWLTDYSGLYSPQNLPDMLTKVSWNKWRTRKLDFKEEFEQLEIPKFLKAKVANFLTQYVTKMVETIKSYVSEEKLRKLLPHTDLSCITPRLS